MIDKYESAPANLVMYILINAQIDTENVFGTSMDSDYMVEIDVVIQAISKCLQYLMRNERIFLELVYP